VCKGYGERTHMRRDQAGKIVEHGKDDMVHHHHYSPHPAPPTCPSFPTSLKAITFPSTCPFEYTIDFSVLPLGSETIRF